ncbi:MAG: STAS domain-containing protein [Methylomonas sp.]|nr:STAS domain-containing protein [Methylomonas sp.]PPD21542.1 MAG: anti-anti-sigma factor [Methylomonas sp.]PPD26309.1 MAG: anti-anti-sigma factor [Methylomonas sp.]PPD38025.1 MAG: anti-anti-sigma factor [Methylomonas sp.]PPD40501.1 MAG: anti-anti-sigma factor [Methylomonas sp.]
MARLTLTEQSPGLFTVEGNLTFATIDQQTLTSFKFLKGIDTICIDLARVGTTDSAGLALMIEWIKHSRKIRAQLRFKNVPDQLMALAKLSGFDKTPYFSGDRPS